MYVQIRTLELSLETNRKMLQVDAFAAVSGVTEANLVFHLICHYQTFFVISLSLNIT